MLAKLLLILKTIFEMVLLFLVLLTVTIVVLSAKGYGGYRAFVLQSGSMTPTMPTGDLIITKESANYRQNDVITFYTNDQNGVRQKLPTTHRIYSVKQGTNLGYETKGDANNTPDPSITPTSSVIGKVVFHLPFFGYLTEFARTPNGLTYLVVIPITILIYQQLVNIYNELIKLAVSSRRNIKTTPIQFAESTPIKLSQLYIKPKPSG
jgi:signal peptidase I